MREPARSVAQSKEEILQLISSLGGRPAPRPVPAPPVARLEVQRWREAFCRDAVVDRLTSLCGLLEERLAALEGEVMAATRGAPPDLAAPAAPPPAPPAPPPAAPIAHAPAPFVPELASRSAAPPAIPDGADLSGRIQEGVLSDVLQLLSTNLKTGRFVITSPEGTAELWYEDGEIRHAEAGTLRGESAFFAALAFQYGTFTFVEGGTPAPERSINNKTQFLILEGLRKMDEEGQGGLTEFSGEHPP